MKKPRHNPKSALRKEPADRATHWQGVADWYDQLVGDEGSDYHQKIVIPGVLRLMQLERGKERTGASHDGSPPARSSSARAFDAHVHSR